MFQGLNVARIAKVDDYVVNGNVLAVILHRKAREGDLRARATAFVNAGVSRKLFP